MPTQDNLPAPAPTDQILAKYRAMSQTDCRSAIVSLKGEIGDRLLNLGKAVYAWKLNGWNIDDLGLNGMTHWLLMIGGDKLYAGLVATFIKDKKMIRRLSALTYEEQKHIADGGKVNLLVMESGKPTTLAISLADVKDDDQLDQILASDYIRSVPEQRIWLESKRARASLPAPDRVGPFEIDADRVLGKFKGRNGDVIDLSTAEALCEALRRASGKNKKGKAS